MSTESIAKGVAGDIHLGGAVLDVDEDGARCIGAERTLADGLGSVESEALAGGEGGTVHERTHLCHAHLLLRSIGRS